jgi:hypothetical protein
MSHADAKIALLIDADNSPAAKIDMMLCELAKHGVVYVRRAYGMLEIALHARYGSKHIKN